MGVPNLTEVLEGEGGEDPLFTSSASAEKLNSVLGHLWEVEEFRTIICTECIHSGNKFDTGDHMDSVLQKEQDWLAEQQSDQAGGSKEHAITDFARNIVSIAKLAPMRMTEAERQVSIFKPKRCGRFWNQH